MHRSFPPLDEGQLVAAEHDLGVEFPPEYRRFLTTWNGGRPQPDTFCYEGHGRKESGMVDWFLGIHSGEHDSLRQYVVCYKGRIPPNLLPVAHDPGGNLICIAISGSDFGAVYFWDHEYESPEGQPPNTNNLYLIAKDFDTFLVGLTPHA